jgi:antitoxin VapB
MWGETMKTAKIFRNGQSQAVRLPKEFRFQEDHVYVKKSGNVVLLIPARDSWDSLAASLSKFTDDFLTDREQPPVQKRERFPR